jgi:hypothetical protein
MKSKLRHITIGTIKYNYIVGEFTLKIFNPKKSTNNEFIKIDFDTRDDLYVGSLIYSGHFKTYKNDVELILNINEPSFVKEIILYLNLEKYDFISKKQYLIEDGIKILEKIGYEVKGFENKVREKGTKEQDLKQATVQEVLLALQQDKLPLATALIFDALDCSLLEAKKIAQNMKKRII